MRQENRDESDMTRYALLFAAVHFPLALALSYLVAAINPNPSGGMGVVAIITAACIVGWRFAVRHGRLFTDREQWTLIAGCLFYICLFEAFGLWANRDRFTSLSAAAWAGIVIFTIGLDFLFLWLAYRYPVGKIMQKKIEKDEGAR